MTCGTCSFCAGSMEASSMSWPLQDIAMANIVWRMTYRRGSGGGSYIAQSSRNSSAIMWAMLVGGGTKR